MTLWLDFDDCRFGFARRVNSALGVSAFHFSFQLSSGPWSFCGIAAFHLFPLPSALCSLPISAFYFPNFSFRNLSVSGFSDFISAFQQFSVSEF
jgi:hypothetical protein